jgi:hypothetical protein
MSFDPIMMIARICHEANKAYCDSMGDYSQLPWLKAPEWQVASIVNGVKFHLENPSVTPEDSHNSWMKEKLRDGWVYGAFKNSATKTHPNIRPYNELSEEQKIKDSMFKSIVDSMRPLVKYLSE